MSKAPTGARTKLAISSVLVAWLFASVFVHRLPHDAGKAEAPLLPGTGVPQSVAEVFAQSCGNCHSERTRWPWYSHVAPVSWLIESDVKRAREHLNLSRWDRLNPDERRSFLTEIATVIENREMPLHRYVIFHPELKLSPAVSSQVIEWTRAERCRLRSSESGVTK